MLSVDTFKLHRNKKLTLISALQIAAVAGTRLKKTLNSIYFTAVPNNLTSSGSLNVLEVVHTTALCRVFIYPKRGVSIALTCINVHTHPKITNLLSYGKLLNVSCLKQIQCLILISIKTYTPLLLL